MNCWRETEQILCCGLNDYIHLYKYIHFKLEAKNNYIHSKMSIKSLVILLSTAAKEIIINKEIKDKKEKKEVKSVVKNPKKQEGSIFYEQSLISDSTFLKQCSISQVQKEQSALTEVSSILQQWTFKPNENEFIKEFRIKGNRFQLTSNLEELTQVISQYPIKKHVVHTITFTIIKNQCHNIYLGIAKTNRLNLRSSAKARDGSTVSFHLQGKKRFHLLTHSQEPTFLPQIKNGDKIQMLINYKEDSITWLINKKKMGKTTVLFQKDDWHPFVTMKNKGDIVSIE